MRCPECGFVNDPSAKICIKCGTKLRSGEAPPRAPSSPGSGKATIMGQVSNMPSWDDPQSAPQQRSASSSQKCSKCGHYPLIADAGGTTCPNCGFRTSKEPSAHAEAADPTRDTTVLQNGQGFRLTEIPSGIVHPYAGPSALSTRHSDLAGVVGATKIEVQQSNEGWTLVANLKPGTTILIGNTFYRFDPA